MQRDRAVGLNVTGNYMKAVRHFCTYFDRNYLVQGMTLYRSLTRHANSFVLWVLCLDDASYETLERLNLANVRPVRLSELENADPELRHAKGNRSLVEYYFTLSPAWPLYLLNHFAEIDLLTYLDSDLQFYSDPEPIFDELADQSVLIIGHRFPEHLKDQERYGVYNVGLLGFRNDANGRECLVRWRQQCLEWCYDRVEDGRFADQKYLDDWPSAHRGVRVLQHKGAGLAPWNWMRYALSFTGGSGRVDDQPLIFFHFQGLKIVNRWLFRPTWDTYDPMPRNLRRRLYGGYLRELSRTRRWVRRMIPDGEIARSSSARYSTYGYREIVYRLLHGQLSVRLGFITI